MESCNERRTLRRETIIYVEARINMFLRTYNYSLTAYFKPLLYRDLSDILAVSCLLSLGEDDLSYFRLEPFLLDTSRLVDLSRVEVFSDLADFLWFFLRFRSDSFFTLDLNIFIFFSFPRISLKKYFNIKSCKFTTQDYN